MSTNITLESIRKPQILEAAIRTIAHHGAHKVTLDDIAREAGLSKGGVTHYYSNKELLFREAFRAFFERIFRRGKETMDSHDDPLEKLLSFGWLYDADDPEIAVGYPLLYDCMVRAAREEDYRSLFHEWVENWVVLLKQAIVEGVKAGRFRVNDPEETARTISAMYHGVATRWYLDRESHTTEWARKSFKLSITRLLANEV